MNATVFEAKVVVKEKTHKYSYKLGRHIFDEITKMFQVKARTQEQARSKAAHYGHVVSVRKANREKIFGNIERLALNQSEPLHFDKSVAMDEMMWRKRQERRKINLEKDHQGY